MINDKMGITFAEIKGPFYCLLYAVTVTVQSNVAKILTYSSHSSYITFVRCCFLALTFPFIETDKVTSCDFTDLILYFICAFCAVSSCGTAVLSFTLIGVGDSTAIEFGGNVIFAGVIGHFVLDEKLSISYFILLLFDCVGVILVVKPSFIFKTSAEGGLGSREVGAIISLLGAVFFALFHVCVRKLEKRNNLHCFLYMTVQGLFGMVLSGAWTTVESAWETPNTWLKICIVVGYGIVNVIQFVFAVKALNNAEAANVALALTLSVVLSYALQLTLFEEEVSWVSIGGAVIIVFCVLLSSSWEYVLEKLDRVKQSYESLSNDNST